MPEVLEIRVQKEEKENLGKYLTLKEHLVM